MKFALQSIPALGASAALTLLVSPLRALPLPQVPVLTEDAYVFADDGQDDDMIGIRVALDGDTLMATAPQANGSVTDSGAVYVFECDGSTWNQAAKLSASDASNGAGFGSDCALQGDRAVIGASNANGGQVYVWQRQAGVWMEQAILSASDTGAGDGFGDRVALDGDTLVVAARRNSSDVDDGGAVYVFRWNGSWQEEARLTAPVPASDDDFGWSLALSGDVLVVGAPGDSTHGPSGGEVWAFERTGNSWSAPIALGPGVAGWNTSFGISLDLDGDRLAVGAPRTSGFTGGVHFFERTGNSSWAYVQGLQALDAQSNSYFGNEVDLQNARLLVGAQWDDTIFVNSGKAYLFTENAGQWEESARLLPGAGVDPRLYASDLALDGTRCALGSWWSHGADEDSGGIYIHEDFNADFQIFCTGDGTGGPCPCGNESNPHSGEGCRGSNLQGDGAFLYAFGSPSASADDLSLRATQMRINFPVQLFVSSQRAALQGLPAGDGLRCLAGPLLRLPLLYATEGFVTWGPGLPSLLGWMPGQTLHFQAAYRDVGSSHTCMRYFNTTNGISVTLVP